MENDNLTNPADNGTPAGKSNYKTINQFLHSREC